MPKHAPLIKLLAVLIGLCFVPSVGDAATTTPPAGTSFVALTQRPLTLRTDEVVSGTLAATQPIHVEVALKLRNPTQLHSFIVQARSPALPLAQRRMTHAQFVALPIYVWFDRARIKPERIDPVDPRVDS